MPQILRVAFCVAAAAFSLAPPAAFAQAFPAKPVRIVVPYEPGGAVDIAARTVSPRMGDELGQPVIIENRGGAAGQIGAQQVARAAPDGYTIMFTIGAAHVLSMFAYKNLPYHPVKDFTPITALVDTVLSVAATASFPANSLTELIDYAKRNPGKVSYGTTGVGGVTHLAMEQARMLTGTEMTHVPYKGGGPLTVNLVGGQIPVGVLPLAPIMQQVRTGKVKVLALLLTKRYPPMPEIQTVVEAVPRFEVLEGTGTWVLGPAGLPQPVLQRLNASIVKALTAPEVRGKLEAGGQLVAGNSPAELAAQIRSVAEVGARLAKAAGIVPE